MPRRHPHQGTHCINCCRRHVIFIDTPKRELRYAVQKKYCNFDYHTLGPTVTLCSACTAYFRPSGSKHDSYWPAMVWAFLSLHLSHENRRTEVVSLAEKWRLIPIEWRGWWWENFEGDVTIEEPPAEVEDASQERANLLTAIAGLKFDRLEKEINKHLVFPSVRCPWGDGVFLHETHLLPYDDLLACKSNYMLQIYSPKYRGRSWVDTCRPDFPSSTTALLNPKFRCRPKIITNREGVFVLCCEQHAKKSNLRFLHVPVNPTGNMSSTNSNQFAPLQLRSRVIRKAKPHAFSDTFVTVRMQGGFDGIDSCYVTNHGRYNDTDPLTMLRDALSISGRMDVKNHVLSLCSTTDPISRLSKEVVLNKITAADQRFPNVRTYAAKELEGSTYVGLEDAVSLQEEIYNEHPLTLQQPATMAGGATKDIVFVPPWPFKYIRVHPYNTYGERFCSARRTDHKSFRIWSLMAVVMCVDELVPILTCRLKTTHDPQGYLLSLVWSEIKSGGPSVKPSAFSLSSVKGLLIPDYILPGNDSDVFEWPTDAIDHFLNQPWIPTDCGKAVAIFEYSTDGNTFVFDPTGQHHDDNWVPTFVLGKRPSLGKGGKGALSWDGIIYARHATSLHQDWWVQESTQSYFAKAPSNSSWSVDDVRLVVFKKAVTPSVSSLMERYLICLGGQTSVYCREHRHPLVMVPTLSSQRICSCNQNAINLGMKSWDHKNMEDKCPESSLYTCPRPSCQIGGCKSHMVTLLDGSNRQLTYLLGSTTCDQDVGPYRTYVSTYREDDDSIEEEDNGVIIEPPYLPGVPGELDPLSSINDDLEDMDHIRDNLGPYENFEVAEDLLHYADGGKQPSFNAGFGTDGRFQYTEESALDLTNPDYPFTMTNVEVERPLHAEFTTEDGAIASFPMHIMLNRQGHLLIRKHAKLRMKKAHAAFFHKLIARSPNTSVPLVYAEGALFSDIFYFAHETGAILGAIPTAFWNDKTTLARFGIASMRGHAWTRVQDPALLTSTNSTYQFMQLDILTNVAMRGNDSRLVLHRGFAEKQSSSEGVAFRNREENSNEELYEDDVENFSNIHKLTRLFETSPPDYFYTQTANHSTAPGLKMLRKWITSTEATFQAMREYTVSEDQAKTILRNASAVYVERAWSAFIDLWMKYIIHSPEEPLGPIQWAWYRKEFQDDQGNVYHIHAMLKTAYDTTTPEGLAVVLNKIHGCKADLAAYIKSQYNNMDDCTHLQCLLDILDNAERYLSHRCGPRCQVPKTDEDGNTFLVCKRLNNYLATDSAGQHTIQEIEVQHSQSALEILLKLGYAKEDLYTGTIKVTDPRLLMKRHIPRCSPLDATMSPTNAALFAKFPSSQNLQNAQRACLSLYLAKYVAGVDRGLIVLLKPPVANDPDAIRAQHQNLGNTKINSVRQAASVYRSQKQNIPAGRPVTLMECLSVLQAKSLVATTAEFIKIPTCPREYRSAAITRYLNITKSLRRQDVLAIKAVIGQTVRRRKLFPDHRLFSASQLEVIRDELDSPLQTDSITIFSMRPPELRFVDNPRDYLQWFIRSPVCELFHVERTEKYLMGNLSLVVPDCKWLDGFNYHVQVRHGEMGHLYQHAVNRMAEEASNDQQLEFYKRLPCKEIIDLLAFLHTVSSMDNSSHQRLLLSANKLQTIKTFLAKPHTSSKISPVIWWSPVHPKKKVPFLVHLLLLYGRFETEYELMKGCTMKEAFIRGGLLNPSQLESSFQRMMQTYVEREIRVLPGSTFQLGRSLVQAYGHLRDLWGLEDAINLPLESPPVLASTMIRKMSDNVEKQMTDMRYQMIASIYVELASYSNLSQDNLLPTKEALQNARQSQGQELNPDVDNLVAFFPPPKHPSQSDESFEEQRRVMLRFKDAVKAYFSGSTKPENIVFVGGPGVGKTTVANFCAAYCLARGLNGITTSFVAERSKQLGGIHLHALLGLRGRDDNASPGRIAELAIQNLYRQPHRIEFIRRLDFLFIDEWGMFSAEYMAILDMVFRYVRNESSLFCGGVLLFCTMDHLQLMSFKGTPGMLSLYTVNELSFCRLVHSVRAADDPALRRIMALTRSFRWTPEDKTEFEALLSQNCHFVDTFEDERIPNDAVFLFGRKEPCYVAEALVLEKMRRLHGARSRFFHCYDEESTTAGNWIQASAVTSRLLDRRVKQRSTILFYPNARFEFTHVSRGQFDQGQLALMLPDQVPTEQELCDSVPVSVWKAPSGVKQFPSSNDCNILWLKTNGWSMVKVPSTTTQSQRIIGRYHARRTQYGLRPRVSSTIHAAMGATLPNIVTAVTSVGTAHAGLNFNLWSSSLVVVLMSRTRRANQMYFVGDREATISHLIEVVNNQNNRFSGIITDLLDKMCDIAPMATTITTFENGTAILPPVLPHPTVFQARDCIVTNSLAVYHLISLQDLHFNYIGATSSLRRRLHEHNSLQGSLQTKNPALLPFALFAYVAGFSDLKDAQHFEHVWRERCRRRRLESGEAIGIVQTGREIVMENNTKLPSGAAQLRLVQCGNLMITR